MFSTGFLDSQFLIKLLIISIIFNALLNVLNCILNEVCSTLKRLICHAPSCFRYAPVLIAMYNLWDLISRYIPLADSLKLESRKGLMIAILSRFLLIPAFYFTAKYGDKGWMILLTSLLGVSNGYLTVCVLTVAPKGYKVR